MTRTPEQPAPQSGFARTLLAELADIWWVYPVIPLVLTIFNRGSWIGGEEFGLTLLVNACATVAIGVTTQALFVLGGRLRIRLPLNLHAPLYLLLGLVLGTELGLALLRSFATFDELGLRRGFWIIGGIVTLLVATISISYDRLRAHARAVELRVEQARREALQAELDALQARMNPHFLFNSLNTVAALIEEDPEAAVLAVERLGALLRYTLERDRAELVPLADELACVRGYLELERARFGERLIVEIAVAPGLERVEIPPLLIQPLVENAVKHAVAPSPTPVRVQVGVRRSEDLLIVEVSDDGPGSKGGDGAGVAQRTASERLRLRYGERARFEAGPRAEGGYRAMLALPEVNA